MNNDAAMYSRYCGAQREWARQLLGPLPIRWDDVRDIIDMGCGTGEVTLEQLAERPTTARVVAFDKYQTMVDFARCNNERENVRYYTADIEDASTFPAQWDAAFDLAFSNIVFHWVNDQPSALANVRRLLKEGGLVYLAFAVGAPCKPFKHAFDRIQTSDKWQPYLKDYVPRWRVCPDWETHNAWRTPDPAAGYKAVLENCGFHVLTCEEKYIEYEFKDDAEAKGMNETISPLAPLIPHDQRAEFMTEWLAYYKEVAPLSERGNLIWPASILLVYAKKDTQPL